MNKRRLLKLADLLEADAKNKKGIKFDLRTWASPSSNEWVTSWNTKENEIKVDCGTTACAVGLACVSGAFARSGLTYGYRPSWSGGCHLVPKFEGSREFNAVIKFFGIKKPEAEFLFTANAYPNRIRKFVDDKVIPPREVA